MYCLYRVGGEINQTCTYSVFLLRSCLYCVRSPVTADEESIDLTSQLETSVNVGDHAFSQMQGDLDQQRLLGERPFNDPLADIMVKEIQHQER